MPNYPIPIYSTDEDDDDYDLSELADDSNPTPQQISPEEAKRRQLFYQKMAYIEMKKLRPKHPHV